MNDDSPAMQLGRTSLREFIEQRCAESPEFAKSYRAIRSCTWCRGGADPENPDCMVADDCALVRDR